MMILTMAGLTDAGRMRPDNEDSIALHPEIGLAVLADGMGGHRAGEVASRLAVEQIVHFCLDALSKNAPKSGLSKTKDVGPETEALRGAIEAANLAIHDTARRQPECAGMGSTVVVALFHDRQLSIGHIGDSRLYRFRSGRLEQLTEDHSAVQELLKRGLIAPEDVHVTVSKNLLTRALGVDLRVLPDISEQPTKNSDIYLICSDGLTDVLPDAEIERLLADYGGNLEEAARQLVAAANEGGGPDNISVILARVETSAPLRRKTTKKAAKRKNRI